MHIFHKFIRLPITVMRNGPDGDRVMCSNGGIDQDYKVDKIDIENDGGDW